MLAEDDEGAAAMGCTASAVAGLGGGGGAGSLRYFLGSEGHVCGKARAPGQRAAA